MDDTCQRHLELLCWVFGGWWWEADKRTSGGEPSALSQLCPQGPSPQSALWPWRQPFVYLGSRFLRIIFPNIFGGKENQPAPSQTSPLGSSPHWGLPNHPQPLAQGLDSDNLMLTLFIVNLWSICIPHVCVGWQLMKCSTATGGFVDAETRTDNILFFCDGDGDGDHGDSNILIKKN